MAIQRSTDKRTCFKTGNTVRLTARHTRGHVAGSQRGERECVRHRQTDGETDFRQEDKDIWSY